jgi:hypothetical protein
MSRLGIRLLFLFLAASGPASAAPGGKPTALESFPYRRVASCEDVKGFCEEHCSKLSGGDAVNCARPCEREEADFSDLNCGQVHHTPLVTKCEEVAEFCREKRCRLLKGLFRDACHIECPKQVATKNQLQCTWPSDGVAKGERHGPPPARTCAEVARNCVKQCAELPASALEECRAVCPRMHAAMSKLNCP